MSFLFFFVSGAFIAGVSCLYPVDSSVLARSLGFDDVHESWLSFFCAFVSSVFSLLCSFWEHAICRSQASQLLDQNDLTAYVNEQHLKCVSELISSFCFFGHCSVGQNRYEPGCGCQFFF